MTKVNYSKYANKLKDSGIFGLMDDLGNALDSTDEKNQKNPPIMMGGGNPALIEPFEKLAQKRLKQITQNIDLMRDFLGKYSPPEGNLEFISNLAKLLNKQYGWKLTSKNICLTSGSQSSFYLLFNLLLGTMDDGGFKKLKLPLIPEYIGYNDSGFESNLISANPGLIKKSGNHSFKYKVDFEALKNLTDIGLLCISRPTNPTANVISDQELAKLNQISKKLNIPLIVDNAYGLPFPSIIHTEVNPIFDENIILCMSLSKIGLPALRTGITIANESIIDMMKKANAIMGLSPPSSAPVIANEWLKTGEILEISKNIVRPYYFDKCEKAKEILKKELIDIPYRLHQVQGGLFFWIWFENLPITSKELYQKFKEKGVIVVAGEYFFAGLEQHWQHQYECIRVNYSYDLKQTQKGFEIMAKVLREIYA